MELFRKKNLFVIFILLSFSCIKENEKTHRIEDVLIAHIEPINNFTQEISSFDLIPLKTLHGPRISKVNKILKSTDGYFLLINDGKEVLHYAEDGELLKSLNKQGRGPEEYTSIGDIAYSEARKSLFVLTDNVIKEYNEEFDYVETYSPEIGWLEKCVILEDSKFLLFANGADPKKNIFIYDFDDNLITDSYSINPMEAFVPSLSGAFGLDDPLIIKSPTSPTFYRYSEKGKLSSLYKVDVSEGLVETWADPRSFMYEDVCHLDDDILMGFIDIKKGKYKMMRINKSSNMGHLYQVSQIPPSEDVDSSIKASLLHPPYRGASSNALYKFISSDDVLALKVRVERMKQNHDDLHFSAPIKKNLEILLSAERELVKENTLDGFIAIIHF